jgi:hypothetical protein
MDHLEKQRAETVVKAHIAWFDRLRKAVETGKSDVPPAVVATDVECEFGKWVHSELGGLCSPGLFRDIAQIHADFHRTAAAILTLALEGRQSEAQAQLGPNSQLGELSKRLVEKVREIG